MEKDKQISEMAKAICHAPTCEIKKNGGTCYKYCKAYIYAFRAVNAGYSKIYDDLQRQCTCYALGCQMAEELKKKVAREIFEQIDRLLCLNSLQGDIFIGKYFDVELETDIAELKKKYESEGEE